MLKMQLCTKLSITWMPHDLLIPSPKKVRLLISYLFGKRNTLLNVISLLPINMIKKSTILNLFFLYFNVHVFVSMTLDIGSHELGKIILDSNSSLDPYATIYLEGKKLGKINRKLSVRIKLSLSFNNWSLVGNLMQDSFTVTDEHDNTIMKLNIAFNSKGTYVLEINNQEHEILSLLLAMAVDFTLHKDN